MDYRYATRLNELVNINKFIFTNSDVGTLMRTAGQNPAMWRIGVVEIKKEVSLAIADGDGNPIE